MSLPMWVWRLTMLAWALWLALRIIKWARWSWGCFSKDGLFKKSPPRRPPAGQPPAGPPTQ
jgi:hypothetical protein